jgi:hypothetical protein
MPARGLALPVVGEGELHRAVEGEGREPKGKEDQFRNHIPLTTVVRFARPVWQVR